jgi:hypothetical protein
MGVQQCWQRNGHDVVTYCRLPLNYSMFIYDTHNESGLPYKYECL